MPNSFIPTLKWHIKVLAVLLVLTAGAFFVFSWVANKLPPQYQPKAPAAQTTPWLK